MASPRLRIVTIVSFLLALSLTACAVAAPPETASPVLSGKPSGSVLVGGSDRIFLLDAQGVTTWEHRTGLAHDTWMLPNGNILFADGATVSEVTPDHKVVFSYKAAEQNGGGAYSCQRLANGNTVVGENSTGRVLEVDSTGKLLFSLQTSPAKVGDHHNMRMVRKLDNDNYLVCHSGAHLVKEYTPDGKVVLEIKTPNLAFAAIRTDKNTTLVSTLEKILEYDAQGKIVWEFANTDIAGVTITNLTGMHLLPNGNLAVGCYAAYKDGQGCGLFQITRDRKLVWSYANPAGDGSMMAIECLDGHGKPLAGKCLR